MGLRCLPTEPVLGLKRLCLPVSYWRTAEFGYVMRRLTIARGSLILDLGSPKDLAFLLARHRGYAVTAIDVLPEAIELAGRYAVAQGMCGSGPGLVNSEVQDGRALPYPDDSFDAAYSVSVLEHIPNNGDTVALRELLRVVKPGGFVVVTTPYDRKYRETFVDGPVYERKQVACEPVFFERHYDEESLARRLTDAVGASLVDREFWGEGVVRGEALLSRLGRLRLAVSPIEWLLSVAFLRRVQQNGRARPMAVFFTLGKNTGPA